MGGVELFLGGAAALAVLSLVVKAKIRIKTAQTAAEITRLGTSPVSLFGRVLVTALAIVGVQWVVLTHSDNVALRWIVLGLPALIAAYALTKSLTVMQIGPSRRRGGGSR